MCNKGLSENLYKRQGGQDNEIDWDQRVDIVVYYDFSSIGLHSKKKKESLSNVFLI